MSYMYLYAIEKRAFCFVTVVEKEENAVRQPATSSRRADNNKLTVSAADRPLLSSEPQQGMHKLSHCQTCL